MNLVLCGLKPKLPFISPVYHLPLTTVSSVRCFSSQEEDYYKILGVGRRATTKEIRDAFIEKSKKLHPDKNQNDPQIHNKFVKLNQAYTILSDSKTRDEYDSQDYQGKEYDYEDRYESANVRARRMKNEYYQNHNPEWIRYREYMARTGYVGGDTLQRIALPFTLYSLIAAVALVLIMGRRLKHESNTRWEEKTRDLKIRNEERTLLKKYFMSLTGTEQRILCDLPDKEFFPEVGRRYLISQGKTPEKQEPSKYLSKHNEIPQNLTYSGHTKKLGAMMFDLKAKGMDINPQEKSILRTYFQSLSGGQQRYLNNLNPEEFFTEIGQRFVKSKGINLKDLKDTEIPTEPEVVDELTLKG